MALVTTPMLGNSARVECTDCPSVLIVSGVAPLLLKALVEGAEPIHVHADASDVA